jgi:predicted ferric reductase
MTDQIWWFATRGAGLMAWAVAAGSVIFGLLMSSKIMGKQPGFPWLLDIHRFFSSLTAVFLALHLVTLWADSYVHFGLQELFLPHMSEWRRGAVTWGVLSMYLLLAVELSSLIRDRIPAKTWHGIHLLSYVSVIFGSIHAWQAGSDVRNPIVLAFGLAALALIVGLTVFRIAVLKRGSPVHKPAPVDRAAMLAAARQTRDQPSEQTRTRPPVQERWAQATARR